MHHADWKVVAEGIRYAAGSDETGAGRLLWNHDEWNVVAERVRYTVGSDKTRAGRLLWDDFERTQMLVDGDWYRSVRRVQGDKLTIRETVEYGALALQLC